MDPISLAPVVLSTWNLLEPYLKKIGGKLVEKAGDAAPDVVGKVWDIVKEKMEAHPETKSMPAELAASPDDQDLQGTFRYQLKKLLENDDTFARQLENLINESKQVTTYTAALEGDGAIAQGPGATAVGKGGVYISGKASGNTIVTGDHNSVNNNKKRKRNDRQRPAC